MTDIRADDPALENDDRLPWLEAVEEEEGRDGPSALKLIVGVLIALAAIGGIVGGAFWLWNRADTGGEGDLIKAPEGAYKTRPDDPGGMTVDGEGDSSFAATQGADPKGSIDTTKVAEAPVTGQPAAKGGEEPLIKTPPPTNAPAQPAAGSPAAQGGGATIQLGAFPNAATAEKAWKSMAGRFAYLAPLSHSVVTAQVNGRTWYRLRASGPDAANVC